MAKNLVIVESPTKVRTIRKFLGSNYQVMASNGHVRDLPKSQLGFDPENDYEPKYITIRGKGDILSALRRAVKSADKVYLATDPDREGEAISWHLYAALKLENKKVYRITFNEITKSAVKEALKNPRQIDMDMVNAQQTRRMLDRMVGYSISPLLWSKVKRGLSAGRVQSVALRIIADREDEISRFTPEEYWTVDALLDCADGREPLRVHYIGNPDKETLSTQEEAEAVSRDAAQHPFVVKDVRTSQRTRKAPLPFTTSTMQQEASRALNFPTSKTMQIAQQLYEGIDVPGEGTVGLITYLRTDSTRISDEADERARSYVKEHHGGDYVGKSRESLARSTRKIQDAHEAIRPSDIERTPVAIKEALTRDQFRLYQLIWRRFTASRMADARFENTSVSIEAGTRLFSVTATRRTFDGYQSVYEDEADTEKEKEKQPRLGKELKSGAVLELSGMDPKQHFTQPPAHYTEASLVHELEELGIGRPSTYAPTITTLIARHYISREKKNLFITDLGEAVNEIMVQEFPTIVDVKFTANMESLLDLVGEGKLDWKSIVRNFYPDLKEAVDQASKTVEKVQIADEESDVVCDQCGRKMVIKYGPYGKFLACPGFPECRNTKPYLEKAGVACPLCGQDIVICRSKKGRRFYGCSNADCTFMSWQKPAGVSCPRCGSYMVHRGRNIQCTNEECGYLTADTAEDDAE